MRNPGVLSKLALLGALAAGCGSTSSGGDDTPSGKTSAGPGSGDTASEALATADIELARFTECGSLEDRSNPGLKKTKAHTRWEMELPGQQALLDVCRFGISLNLRRLGSNAIESAEILPDSQDVIGFFERSSDGKGAVYLQLAEKVSAFPETLTVRIRFRMAEGRTLQTTRQLKRVSGALSELMLPRLHFAGTRRISGDQLSATTGWELIPVVPEESPDTVLLAISSHRPALPSGYRLCPASAGGCSLDGYAIEITANEGSKVCFIASGFVSLPIGPAPRMGFFQPNWRDTGACTRTPGRTYAAQAVLKSYGPRLLRNSAEGWDQYTLQLPNVKIQN